MTKHRDKKGAKRYWQQVRPTLYNNEIVQVAAVNGTDTDYVVLVHDRASPGREHPHPLSNTVTNTSLHSRNNSKERQSNPELEPPMHRLNSKSQLLAINPNSILSHDQL